MVKQSIINLRCSSCHKKKGLAEFSRNRSTKTGYQTTCKSCGKEAYKRRLLNNESPSREGSKTCIDCKKEKEKIKFPIHRHKPSGLSSRCHPCNKKYDQARWLQRYYKLSIIEYHKLLKKQNGKCAVCGDPPPKNKRLFVDHDHKCCPGIKTCGQCIRGLLCSQCNSALGMLDEDIKLISRLAKYIRKYKPL